MTKTPKLCQALKPKVSRRLVLGGLAALPACQTSSTKLDAKVIVLGAGLAGLNAARLLSQEGQDVLVLEGSSRIGGRVHTLNHGEIGYTEGGGEQIGANYARLIDTARALNVPLVPDKATRGKLSYFYQGRDYSPESLRELKPFPFPPPFETSSPTAPLFMLAGRANPLKAPQDWMDPQFSKYDISAHDFLQKAGFQNEAQKLIEHTLNGNSLETYSMMNLYRTLYLYSQSRGMGASFSVVGGTQRLPEAMAASLPQSVKLNQMVTKISVEAEKVIIETKAGKTYRAEQCVCTLPFGALRNIELQALMSEDQRAAIKELPYTQILQLHLRAQTPFWEMDGQPADMWTDLPIERVFANRNSDGKPNGLFRLWINGVGATRSTWENRLKISEQVRAYMKTVRPASEGKFDVLAVQDWTHKNPLAGGAYMHWAPGQIGKWAKSMGAHKGMLVFAGEHLSRLHTGMEGAMESGENAAFHLLNV